MTSRERVLAAIRLEKTDHLPFMHAMYPGVMWRYGRELTELLERYPDDFGDRGFAAPAAPAPGVEFEEYQDEWGSVWVRRVGYSAGEVKKPALASWDDFAGFVTPPPTVARHFNEAFRPGPSAGQRDWYALSGWFDLFERMQFLRGTENLLIDFALGEPALEKLADMIVERNLAMIQRYIEDGVDGVFISDDWGSQDRLLISPDLWRQFFRPRYARMFAPLKEAGKHIFFHSCGWTVELWPELIALGADVLNVQHSLFPDDVLRRELAGKVCVCSDPDRQHTMPRGTPEEVTQHLNGIIKLFGESGGLIMRGELAQDWPMANIRAMYAAFGRREA